MDKPVSILICNYTTYEAVQLCVESVRALTDYPDFRIVVHDDESINNMDVPYLERAERRGWIRLIKGTAKAKWRERGGTYPPHVHKACFWHGHALDALVNGACDTPLAVTLDADVRVKDPRWLRELLAVMDDQTLVVADEIPGYRMSSGQYCLPYYALWFALLNMDAYHDGMAVDWMSHSGDIRQEPYATLMAGLRDDSVGEPGVRFAVTGSPGSCLWTQMAAYNPKGYKARPVPYHASRKMMEHATQISVRCDAPGDDPRRTSGADYYDARFIPIKRELSELREKYADKLR